MSSWIVLKFGGTSVSSAERWHTIAQIATQRINEGLRPFLVCSALSGVTNLLEALIDASLKDEHEPILTRLRQEHRDLADALGIDAESLLGKDFRRLERLAEGISLLESSSPAVEARVLAHGEILSTKLGHAFLQTQGLNTHWNDARDLLHVQPDRNAPVARQYLAGRCHEDADPELEASLRSHEASIHITQGFIAGNEAGETVLLGRGGSDTSAAYLAARLQAQRLEIWTDVPGLFTANPHLIPSARLLRKLSYEEAQELATMGASVLHPRCIGPVQRHAIPLQVHATNEPEVEGTIVSQKGGSVSAQVKAISAKHGIHLISMQTLGMWQQVGFMADVFGVFKSHGFSIDLVATSETDVTVSLDPSANLLNPEVIEPLMSELNEYCTARRLGPTAVVSLVGSNLRSLLPKIGAALDVFDQQQVHLITQASSDLNLSFVIEEEQVERVLGKLHDRLFGTQPINDIFGPSWQALLDAPAFEASPRWWHHRRSELLELASEHAPCYVYDEETALRAAQDLLDLPAVDRTFYSMKANAHESILRSLETTGIGFECVSADELQYIRDLFPDIDPHRLLFTPNFAPRKEYEYALTTGAHITLDNLYTLEAWPDLFRDTELILRIDPGHGRGHHKHVRTAGVQSKFGVSIDGLPDVSELAGRAGARIIGLHAHVGSGITDPKTWAQIGSVLASQTTHFPDVRILNVGGGLGIPERPDTDTLDLQQVNDHLQTVHNNHPHLELWMEPGRFIVAEAGVLLARVTQLKQKAEDVQYVGLETGMNSLIRPALYGAYHEIVNLTRLDEPETITADVVGPICESGDVLGHNRHLPETKEGDILLIAKTGAYGYVMHSRYNRRPPASEIYLQSEPSVIE